jgi:prolyl 4-hydroxylase
MHYPWISDLPQERGILGHDKQAFYQNHLDGCARHYDHVVPDGPDKESGEKLCHKVEDERIARNMRQPQSVLNYTANGFAKVRAPKAVWELIQAFWKENRDQSVVEQWEAGSTFVNHWDSPTDMVSVENVTLLGGGTVLKNAIWNAARDTIPEWTGNLLAECSLYGIRIYHQDSILAPHVDRLPLVSSAILMVDQDVDEPWPLEVIGHDGRAHNVTMEPGDLVLYESHSLIHGVRLSNCVY